LRRISTLGAVAGGAWAGLEGLRLLHAAGADLPHTGLAACAAASTGLALVAAGRTAAWAFRGPLIATFPAAGAAVCDPAEAEAVRASAQLRGTMGGAGHVHRARLAFPAVAWAAAAAVAAFAGPLLEESAPWVVLLVAASVAGFLLPAKPFYYREATGGRVAVYPPSARDDLLRLASGRASAGRSGAAANGA
jgi:hypothetical protein